MIFADELLCCNSNGFTIIDFIPPTTWQLFGNFNQKIFIMLISSASVLIVTCLIERFVWTLSLLNRHQHITVMISRKWIVNSETAILFTKVSVEYKSPPFLRSMISLFNNEEFHYEPNSPTFGTEYFYLSIYLMVYSLHHNVLPTLQSIPLMTNGSLHPIIQDSSCNGQHTMPRNPWSYPMTSSA